MNKKDVDLILELFKNMAKEKAIAVQNSSSGMTSTELVAEENFIPDFNPERQYLNFKPGYICKTSTGNVVQLIQAYDSTIYPQQPEELPAQWRFHWSTDPAKAKPFISISTSPYAKGDCCIHDDHVYRSLIDNNVWSPADNPSGWEMIEEEENELSN